MNNFREKANQFLKENYGVENYITKREGLKKSILKFFKFLEDKKSFDIDSDEVINMVMENIVSTDINKIIKVILYCSHLEEEGWSDCSAYPGYCDIPEVSEPFEKRENELSNLWDEDEEKYIKRFGEQWEPGTERKELKYCLQDISKDSVASSLCFEHVVKSCLEYILGKFSSKINIEKDLDKLLNIVL